MTQNLTWLNLLHQLYGHTRVQFVQSISIICCSISSIIVLDNMKNLNKQYYKTITYYVVQFYEIRDRHDIMLYLIFIGWKNFTILKSKRLLK